MSVKVGLDKNTKSKFVSGIETLYNAVKSTMGPAGSTVIIEDIYNSPIVTKDGVTVAKSIKLKDPVSNMGVQLVKEASIKTNDKVGDGTTTSTVIAWNIYNNYVNSDLNNKIKRECIEGIQSALNDSIEFLREKKVEIKDSEDVFNISMISSNGDQEISNLITEAIEKVGVDGTISINECPYMNNCTLDIMSGTEYKSGYISRYLTTDPAMSKAEFTNPLILVVNKPISYADDIVGAMSLAVSEKRELFIIAHDFDGQALATLVTNKMKGVIKVCGVKATRSGDERKDALEDIASLVGATVIDEISGIKLKDVTLEYFGTCDKLICELESTTFIGTSNYSRSEEVASRLDSIKEKLESVGTNIYKKNLLEARHSMLAGGVAILNIGGATESEIREKRDRVEDTIHATEAAVESGTLVGGGYSLIELRNNLLNKMKGIEFNNVSPSFKLGYSSFVDALLSPNTVIRDNAQLPPLEMNEDGTIEFDGVNGIDILTLNKVNLRESGIIDPYKVTESALICSSSIAKVLISTECIITSTEDTDAKDNSDVLNKF